MRYICEECGFILDESVYMPLTGLPEGSGFYDLPEDWVCPLCGAPRSDFQPE